MTKQSINCLIDIFSRAGMAPIVLANEYGRALVVPELGARLLAVSLAEGDCLWHDPSLGEPDAATGWNAGGQRTWIAPEHAPESLFFVSGQWRCPPGLDPGSYRVTRMDPGREVSLVNTFSRVVDASPVQYDVRRRITLLPGDGCFVVRVEQGVRHTGRPGGSLPAGAWAILQAPVPGFAHVEIARVPAGPCFHDEFFEPLPRRWLHRSGRRLVFYLSGSQQYKVGIPASLLGRDTRVRYFHRDPDSGLWLEIRQIMGNPPVASFAEAPGGTPSPNGDLLQFYNHFTSDEQSYAELEGHAPAVDRAGEESTLIVRYEFAWHTEEGLERQFLEHGEAGPFRFMLGMAAGAGATREEDLQKRKLKNT